MQSGKNRYNKKQELSGPMTSIPGQSDDAGWKQLDGGKLLDSPQNVSEIKMTGQLVDRGTEAQVSEE